MGKDAQGSIVRIFLMMIVKVFFMIPFIMLKL